VLDLSLNFSITSVAAPAAGRVDQETRSPRAMSLVPGPERPRQSMKGMPPTYCFGSWSIMCWLQCTWLVLSRMPVRRMCSSVTVHTRE